MEHGTGWSAQASSQRLSFLLQVNSGPTCIYQRNDRRFNTLENLNCLGLEGISEVHIYPKFITWINSLYKTMQTSIKTNWNITTLSQSRKQNHHFIPMIFHRFLALRSFLLFNLNFCCKSILPVILISYINLHTFSFFLHNKLKCYNSEITIILRIKCIYN